MATWGRPQQWEDDVALPAAILEAMPQPDLALSPQNDTILALTDTGRRWQRGDNVGTTTTMGG